MSPNEQLCSLAAKPEEISLNIAEFGAQLPVIQFKLPEIRGFDDI